MKWCVGGIERGDGAKAPQVMMDVSMLAGCSAQVVVGDAKAGLLRLFAREVALSEPE